MLRKAIKPLLDEQSDTLSICVFCTDVAREINAAAAYYVTTVNAAELPNRKGAKSKIENKVKLLKEISIHGFRTKHDYAKVNARAVGNTLCHSLTMLPPNELTPTIYREKVKKVSQRKWLEA